MGMPVLQKEERKDEDRERKRQFHHQLKLTIRSLRTRIKVTCLNILEAVKVKLIQSLPSKMICENCKKLL